MIKPIKTNKNIRKSGFEDMFFVMVVLIGMAFFFIFLAKTWSSIKPVLNDGLTSSMPSDTSINITETLDQTTGSTTSYNKLFPFLLIGVFGFVFVSAGFMTQHPIMIFVGIIVLGAAIILAVAYSNVYHQITQTDELASTTAQFGIMDIFMKYLPLVIFMLAIGITVALLIRRGGGGSGGL